MLELLAADPALAQLGPPRPDDAWRVHVADSLSGLELEPLTPPRRIADVGSGAGFPGLVLAAALPEAEVDLIESVARKCEFMRPRAGGAPGSRTRGSSASAPRTGP